jgi:hypothetical protein
LGPLPQDIDVVRLDASLAVLDDVDPAVGVEVEGKTYAWQPYSFSWRWGVEGDPGHQGYHGLKENITDDFICLGKPKVGLNETLYADEEGSRYYLWTTALSPEETEANIVVGSLKPAVVYLNGERLADMETRLKLRLGNNPLLLRYDRPGRGHFVLERNNAGEKRGRIPLTMQWYDAPGLVLFDAYPSPARAAGWYRFTAPPGLHGMTAIIHGNVEGWVNGQPLPIEQVVPQKNGAIQYKLRLEKPAVEKSTVALRVKPIAGFYGGSAIPEPIKLECGAGLIALGDWSKGSALECYSGGALYSKSITSTTEQVQGQVALDLGEVVATAEVLVNGRVTGIRVAPPWIVDITEYVKVGENRIEVLVYNTLANQYLTVPTRYRRSIRSGLIGPVRIETHQEVTLQETGLN